MTRVLDGRNRAQLILVGGLALAVTLVVMALVLNTVIFTGNLASRDVDAGVDEAIGFQESVTGLVGDRIDAVAGTSGFTTQRDAVKASIEDLDETVPAFEAEVGTATTVSFVSATEGRRVYQDTSDTFESEGGSEDWQVLDDTDRVRRFRVSVDDGGLFDIGSGALSDSFQVVFDGPGNEDYTIYIYQDDATSDPEIRVERDGTLVGECLDPSGDEVTIDITGATVDGVECPALAFLDDIGGSYDVSFENGDESTGTWSVLAPAPTVAAATAGGDAPDGETVVYEARVLIGYRSADVDYSSTVRVAPGEQGPVREATVGSGVPGGGGTLTPTPTATGPTPTPSGPVDPTVDSTTYSPDYEDGSGGDPDRVEFTVDWTVSDGNANLDEITVQLIQDNNGKTRDTETQFVTGSSASDTTTVAYESGGLCGKDFEVVLTVEDTTGRTDTETERRTASC